MSTAFPCGSRRERTQKRHEPGAIVSTHDHMILFNSPSCHFGPGQRVKGTMVARHAGIHAAMSYPLSQPPLATHVDSGYLLLGYTGSCPGSRGGNHPGVHSFCSDLIGTLSMHLHFNSASVFKWRGPFVVRCLKVPHNRGTFVWLCASNSTFQTWRSMPISMMAMEISGL
jgi:hypothetical protein